MKKIPEEKKAEFKRNIEKIKAKYAKRREERKANLVDMPKPRYDEVFFKGLEWLNKYG